MDNNHKNAGEPIVEDDHVAEHALMTAQNNEERNEHRKSLHIWIGVGVLLLVIVMLAILIPTVFLNHDSGTPADAEAVQGLDTEQVRYYH
jgi:hypothetical protein